MKKSTALILKQFFRDNKKSIKEIEKTNNFDYDSGYSDCILENELITMFFKFEGLKL